MRICTVIAVASLLFPLGAAAQIVPAGPEFQVNSYTTSNQIFPAVAAGADGAFVVVWNSAQDGSGDGVFGQRYDNAGQAVGTEFQVNSYTPSFQVHPAVAAGADGAFVVVWASNFQDDSSFGVFGQRYDNAGQAVGTEFQVNRYTLDNQSSFSIFQGHSVSAGADGAFVVVWASYYQDGHRWGVFGQRYDSAGQAAGAEFQVNSYTSGYQLNPAVAVGADGAFVVAWDSAQDGSGGGVFGQRYDNTGQPVGTEFQVNSYTPGVQRSPAVAAGADGTFAAAWNSAQDGSGDGVFGQRYDSAGQPVGTEFQVNSYTTGYQFLPAVAAGADGAFVVAWNSTQDGGGYGVFGQRYDSAGQPVGTEFQVNSYTTNSQFFPAVTAGADGTFVVAWISDYQDGSGSGVFGQRFAEVASTPTATPTITPTNTPTSTPTQTPTLTPTPSIATCPAAPSGTCATSLKAQLQLKLNASDTKDKLKWKFSGGPALAQGDFGDPTTSATYALCLYDDGALKAELQVGPSGTLWVPVGSKGYKYSDAAGTSDGITKINLLGGDADKSKLLLKGKGSALPMPTPFSGTRFFAQTSAVTAQLREVNGDCYATTFTDAETVKNTGTQYKAKK